MVFFERIFRRIRIRIAELPEMFDELLRSSLVPSLRKAERSSGLMRYGTSFSSQSV